MTALARIHDRLSAAIPDWPLALLLRLGVAAPFFLSGRTKVEGLLTITPSTRYLTRVLAASGWMWISLASIPSASNSIASTSRTTGPFPSMCRRSRSRLAADTASFNAASTDSGCG